jgi:YhcH/YjgK/YiaL family protein
MVVGSMKNIAEEINKYGAGLKRGFEFIKNTDFTKLSLGRHEIDGDRIYANVDSYKSRPKSECRPEAHEKYIDIQYIAKGCEIIGYSAQIDDMKVAEDHLKERDVIFYEDIPLESGIVMQEGMYAVFFPQDVHRPCCQFEHEEDVLKIVVKVRVDVL